MSTAAGTGRHDGRLRLARQARSYSQQQLAGIAGVSRQAVSAIEAGHSDPSLRVALALARALGMTVEELFGPDTAGPAVTASAVAPLGPAGSRVVLAVAGEQLVALPLTGPTSSRFGFKPAGGLVAGTSPGDPGAPATAPDRAPGATALIRPIDPPRPTVIVAGCDPALPLLEWPLSLLDPAVALAWWPCTSQQALRLAAAGLVHAAGVHLLGPSGSYNTDQASELLPGGATVIGFCAWREGLVLGSRAAGRVTGLADVVRHRLRLVNREPGAEARSVLDRELARLGVNGAELAGYDTAAAGHLEVAAAIAAGLADAGIASEPAALAFGLRFVPLAAERFDLVIPESQSGSREAQALTKVLTSRWLLDQLASLPGYDVAPCGQLIARLGSAGAQ